MASKSKSYRSYREDDEEEVVEEALETKPSVSYNTIKLVNTINAKVKLPGSITGKLYVWERAGAVVEVDERDAPTLLEKSLGGRLCCGNTGKNLIFSIID